MLLGRPWLRDAKVSHNRVTNIITIQGTNIIRTVLVTKKLGVQTKRLEVLICYDFHFRIFDEEDDVMFAKKISVGTIAIPIHIKHVPTPIYIPDLGIVEPIQNQLIKLIDVLVGKLIIPPNTIKQHLLKTFFHSELGEMIIDETLA